MRRLLEPDEISEELVPAPSAKVYALEIDGEAVLLDEDANRLHRLNPSATIVWASFDGQSRIRDIAADLADALGVPGERAMADVLAVTRALAAQGLLEPAECEPEPPPLGLADKGGEPAGVVTQDPRFVPQLPSP